MMNEEWKDVPGCEGIYQVSNVGNVKMISTTYSDGRKRKVQSMSTFIDKDGYVRTTISIGKKNIQIPVHRLVAMAFIDNPNGFTQVNHKDENKQNNNVKNLEWCDAKYNTNYGHRSEKISGEKHGLHKLTVDSVRYIRSHYIPFHPKYNSVELAKKYNVSPTTIRAVIHNKTWEIKEGISSDTKGTTEHDPVEWG